MGGVSAPGSHEADINSLRDVEIAEEQAWSSKDLEKVLSFYADDATVMYPNAPTIVGKGALRAYEKQFFADPAFTHHPIPDHGSGCGSIR